MKDVIIYTDGACSGNPGKGGWGCVLIYKNIRKEMSGYCDSTTNNRMELTAVIKALSQLKETCNVNLYTDSAYVSNAFINNWIDKWEKNSFRGSDNKTILNLDLWSQLINLTKKHVVTFHKVKGHSTNELNNLCDKLATEEIENHK